MNNNFVHKHVTKYETRLDEYQIELSKLVNYEPIHGYAKRFFCDRFFLKFLKHNYDLHDYTHLLYKNQLSINEILEKCQNCCFNVCYLKGIQHIPVFFVFLTRPVNFITSVKTQIIVDAVFSELENAYLYSSHNNL